MNLLVIEDDRKLNRMLCEILEKEGYTVKACTDGEEGAYYLQQNAYDLALVDWMLPGESGPDILRESRRKGIMTPVVMLTALTAVENKVTCLDAGADDYLGKPFDSRELLARVRANLRRQAPIEELVVLRYGDLVYDTKALLLACGREEIAVSKKLGLMIELFMKRKNVTSSIWKAKTIVSLSIWMAYAKRRKALRRSMLHWTKRNMNLLHLHSYESIKVTL